jgi:hypothetical protein
MKTIKRNIFVAFIITIICLTIYQGCGENPSSSDNMIGEEESIILDLGIPYIKESDVSYIQPFGVPLDFGGGDIRPHEAIDLGCDDGVEFIASATGTLGNIWLNYPHSYQFNIVINENYIIHYCIEPINIESLSDEEKLAAIYFQPGDFIEKGQKIAKMVGGGGHLDWGLIVNDERVCPACHLSDEVYTNLNDLFQSLPGSYDGYESLCPNNSYHTNPRP